MERNYATQMDAARRGIVTPELKKVAEKEYMAVEDLMPLVASGKVAIPANKLHTCIDPEGIGSMLRTKINVNLGVSKDCKDYDVEMQKVLSAVNMGAEAIMDLSSHGNTQPFRRKLTSECPAMIGTVPVYDSVIHYQRDLDTLTAKDFIDVIRLHAEDSGGAAENAGLKSGYVLTSFDGHSITSTSELKSLLQYYSAGETVEVEVQVPDNGSYETKTFSLTLGTSTSSSDDQQSDSPQNAGSSRSAEGGNTLTSATPSI